MRSRLGSRMASQAQSVNLPANRVAAVATVASAVHAVHAVATGDPNATATAEGVKTHATSPAAPVASGRPRPGRSRRGGRRRRRGAGNRDQGMGGQSGTGGGADMSIDTQ